MRLLLILAVILSQNAFAKKDSLQSSIDIAAKGMEFQSERMKIASENMANISTTSDVPGGNPYIRKVIYGKNKYDKKYKTNILKVEKVDIDKKTPLKLVYNPHHPAADKDGYVKMPNVNRDIEKADILEAQRNYEANLTAIEVSKSMIKNTLEAIR